MKNYEEFTFANTLYWGIAEGNASEMAAKRTAMENATKNAGRSCHVFKANLRWATILKFSC